MRSLFSEDLLNEVAKKLKNQSVDESETVDHELGKTQSKQSY